MRKKTIMFCIFTFNLLIFLIYAVMGFAVYPEQQVGKDKAIVTVRCREHIEPEEYINIIYNAAAELHTDVLISVINDDYTTDYYRTSEDPSLIALDCIDDPAACYATNPQGDERKIPGFFVGSNHFRILPLRAMLERDVNVSVQLFLIPEDAIDDFSAILSNQNLEMLSGMGMVAANDFSSLYMIMAIFAVFLAIAEVFYVFSCSKEMIVSKTLGYSDFNIVCSQWKQCGYLFVVICAGLLLLTVIASAIVFDFSSAFLFVKRMFWKYICYMVGAIVFFTIAVLIVSFRCSIADSKGKSLNRDLFVITAGFKTAIIVFLAISMTSFSQSARDMLDVLKATKQAKELVDGYAATELNTRLEDPFSEPEKYAPILFDFYNALKKEHGLIVASFRDAEPSEEDADNDHGHSHSDMKIDYPMVTINDTYLDENPTIFDVDGNTICSSMLQEKKQNILVPENCEIDAIVARYTRSGDVSADELNFIYYSGSSRFFTYSNEVCASTNSFCTDVIAEVYDPAFEFEHYSDMTFSAVMSSLLSNSMYFRYDHTSDINAYEQILPLLRETGADKIMISAPDMGDRFNSNVKYYRNIFIYEIVQLLIVLLSFVILIVFTTELYYRNYAKDISLKLIYGYSFLGVYMYRMIFKAAILPLLLLIGTVSLEVALFCVIAELLIFVICIKKNMMQNTAAILKGE